MYKHKNGIMLKKLERGQLDMLKMLKDESWFGTHNIAIVNMDDQYKWFDSLDNRKNIVMIAYDTLHENKIVGLYKIWNIDWMNRKYDEAMDVFSWERGKGYGYTVLEAGVAFGFEILNINRQDAEVLETNTASLKVHKKNGFTIEGLKRKAIWKPGGYVNSVVLGITREDWEKMK